nr:thioredoxin domain-containing protein [Corynebacterium aquatimens]
MEYNKDEGIIKLSSNKTNDDSIPTALFQDYSCSYCGELARATDADMIQKVQDGEITVEIRPLIFLDQGAVNHSTRALAASLALVDEGNPSLYSAFNRIMMERQAEMYQNSSAETFANLADQLGASKETVDKIRDDSYVEAAQDIGAKNATWLNENTGSVSSPRVFINGEEYTEDQKNWLTDGLAKAREK